MKTRFSSLVTLKKSTMEKSEQIVQRANIDINSATIALQSAYDSLQDIHTPQTGNISELLASRTLFSSQRILIQEKQQWLEFAKKQLEIAKEQLKLDMIEFEKFKYLELEEMKKIIKAQDIKDAKDLDEIALMTFTRKLKLES